MTSRWPFLGAVLLVLGAGYVTLGGLAVAAGSLDAWVSLVTGEGTSVLNERLPGFTFLSTALLLMWAGLGMVLGGNRLRRGRGGDP